MPSWVPPEVLLGQVEARLGPQQAREVHSLPDVGGGKCGILHGGSQGCPQVVSDVLKMDKFMKLAEAPPFPSLDVLRANAEVFNKEQQVAAARRLATDVVVGTVISKGQVVHGEVAAQGDPPLDPIQEEEGPLDDIRVKRAMTLLRELLGTLAQAEAGHYGVDFHEAAK